MWPRRSHILGPLTDAMGQYSKAKNEDRKLKFIWTKEIQKAFEEMKVFLTTDAITAHPDHNKPFKIYTDASDDQLGACIMQEYNGVWRPVAYYNRKLNKAQKNYTVMEKNYYQQ